MRLSPCFTAAEIFAPPRLAKRCGEEIIERTEIEIPGATRNTAAALAVERFHHNVAVPARNDLISARSRVSSVGGIRSGNSVTNTFSGALRTLAGSLTTSVLG